MEHPGIFREYLRADGICWDTVELDAGERIPSVSAYDALWVMGGPMDVWQRDAYPWLTHECNAIREAVVEQGMPFLGICLGHQLLAQALGGTVRPALRCEVGIYDVTCTAEGRESPLLAGVPSTHACLQWHSSEVDIAPPEARILVSSPACRIQAMSVGEHAFSLQYHVEATETTVSEWSAEPTYRRSLVRIMGDDGITRLQTSVNTHLQDFGCTARRIYNNFMRIVRN